MNEIQLSYDVETGKCRIITVYDGKFVKKHGIQEFTFLYAFMILFKDFNIHESIRLDPEESVCGYLHFIYNYSN